MGCQRPPIHWDPVPTAPVTEILQLLVLMWTCPNLTTKGKNSIFDKVFPNTSILAGFLSPCSIVCCPGLFDILQAPTAPTLSRLKSLPTDYSKRWAIYLVPEKPSCVPKVYIGSGTSTAGGVSQRMSQYTASSPCYNTLQQFSTKATPSLTRVCCYGRQFPLLKTYHYSGLSSFS